MEVVFEKMASIAWVLFQLPERTEKECRVRWLKLEHPAINHSNWTKKEIVKLQSLAKKYKNRHWEKIAEELGVRIHVANLRVMV